MLKGHSDSVTAITFHPKDDSILYTCSKDKTIRVWNIKDSEAKDTYQTDQQRFWCIATDKHSDLVAAGHDEGLIVFRMVLNGI